MKNIKTIAFAGVQGAYSDLACRAMFPSAKTLPCARFDLAFTAVEKGDADAAMIPIENSSAGRVTDVIRLLPETPLKIIAEHFQPVSHCLMATKGSKIESLKTVLSHPQALMQCRENIQSLNLQPLERLDTAGAAEEVAKAKDATQAAIASKLAAQIYGLEILQENFEDVHGNTTRFLVFAKPEQQADIPVDAACITSFIFRVRNIPAALFKAIGGFATNGVNMLKLESYMNQSFQNTMFLADIAGHPESTSVKLALEELSFFTEDVKLLGTYLQSNQRKS